MRTYRARSGPFPERPFYSDDEIEQICESALRDCQLFPAGPEPVRVERFIEHRFGVSPRYEGLPEGVLGYSCFGSRGLESMHIASALLDAGTSSAARLANSTLAHEAGHGLLHAHLFAFASGGMSLFGADPDVTATRILCRDEPRRSYDGRWWELQAGKAIGPVLMPRALVIAALGELLTRHGTFGVLGVETSVRDQASRLLADTFEVNPAAGRVRLDVLFPQSSGQLTF